VFGGKITTYRRLAEAALAKLGDHLPAAARPSWTGSAPLPGGDFPKDAFDGEVARLKTGRPFLDHALATRLVRAYGTRAERILDGARDLADLGQVFGANLTEREVLYLMDEEWAETAADVLWRRSKLGLRLTPAHAGRLDGFMQSRIPRLAAAAE
jgi:glycerol-3-phosphate dehydrogenase